MKPAEVFNRLMDKEECKITRDSFFDNINAVCQAQSAEFELSYGQKDEVWRHLDGLECLRNRSMNMKGMQKAFF